MKPTTKLLRGARPAVNVVPSSTAKPERDVLVERQRSVERDVRALATAKSAIAKRLDGMLATVRKDARERPAPVRGTVVIRVLGATCDDRTPVPLPNLRVTLVAHDKSTSSAVTDVTGLALLPAPAAPAAEEPEPARPEGPEGREGRETREGREPTGAPRREIARARAAAPPTYRLTIAASDGSEVARVDGDPSRTHLVTLGDAKGIEAHAALGRGWLAAVERAAAKRDEVVKKAEAALAEVSQHNTDRLAAITKRLGRHFR